MATKTQTALFNLDPKRTIAKENKDLYNALDGTRVYLVPGGDLTQGALVSAGPKPVVGDLHYAYANELSDVRDEN